MLATMRVGELTESVLTPYTRAAELLDPAKPAGSGALILDGEGNKEISYGELREDSARFAAALRTLGVGPGDRVAVLMAPSLELVVAMLGMWRLGAAPHAVPADSEPEAIIEAISAGGARLVICDAGQRKKLVPAGGIPNDASPLVVVARGEAFGYDASFAEMMGGTGAFAGTVPFDSLASQV